ncbi:tetrapyrrole biosynthesis, uroporphyrinogen III synthase [Exidia glandulosa HHB12029]|uniref:Tetrapyrrole biosynthesis, uroporphyrinogen III synthase n=1 Tax=Exidia glandulosa HHB12029 TaxID=1314781 RepID=A0A165ELA8_EXIGL|nr:tetrapyrrole biosynthesis, uroporphyrinogen III synthase [Exidia glandulosa HHB12029]
MATTVVLLLKTPSDELSSDPYHVEFNRLGFRPVFVPILDTVFTSQSELQRIIAAGPRNISGITVTSGRAADAWRDAAEMVAQSERQPEGAAWSSVPFYAVGETTSRTLRALSDHLPQHLCPDVDLILGASEAGTSEALAHYIVKEHHRYENGGAVLELVGDKNKDNLRTILAEAGISSERLQVYGTGPSPSFANDLERAVVDIPPDGVTWIALFAPSATEFAIPHLKNFFQLPTTNDGAHVEQAKNRPALLASIGPTTAAFLRETLSLYVAVVAPKPDALQLASAIASYQSHHDEGQSR